LSRPLEIPGLMPIPLNHDRGLHGVLTGVLTGVKSGARLLYIHSRECLRI